MDNLSCDIKKLLKTLEALDDYDVERLVIEHLQRNLNTLDELQQSYQRHYLTIIQTLLQQLAKLPTLEYEAVQKRLAFLEKLIAQSPFLSDLETLQRGLGELQAMLGPLSILPPSEQPIGDLPIGHHLPPQLELILKEQAQQLLQWQRQLVMPLTQIQRQLASAKAQNERLTQELQHARTLSLTDELTGLPNRRGFLQRVEEEIARVERHPSPLTLAIIDIDHFKQINDRYGHAIGDSVLRAYAEHIQSVFRRHDHVARFGGEEFAFLPPNTNIDGAVKALTKIHARIDGHTISTKSGAVPLPTFSAGVTSYYSKESAADFIERADRALYRAKQNGRNRIETAD